jgi:hypothetical protein
MTDAAAARTRGGVRAYSVEAIELDQLAFPDEIVALPSARVAISVGEHQPAGDPWHRFIVYLVIAEGQDEVAWIANPVQASF